MPFIQHVSHPFSAGRPAATEPRVAMSRLSGVGTTIYFNALVMRALKWMPGDRVDILVGTGADDGTLFIRRNVKGGFKLGTDKKNKREASRVNSKTLFPGEPVKSRACIYDITAEGLYIKVPLIFRATPASADKQYPISMVAAE